MIRLLVPLAAPLFFFVLTCHVAGQEPPGADDASAREEALRTAIEAIERAELQQKDDGLVAPTAAEEINRRLTSLQKLDPAGPLLPYLFGRAYALFGRVGDAIEQLRKFVETRDGRNEWEAHRRLGDLFVEEFPTLAKASYGKALALKTDEPTALLGLSICAYKSGDLDEALRLAQQAVESDGRRTVRVVAHLARMFIANGQWAEADRSAVLALELAEAAVRKQPGRRGPLQTMEAQYDLLIDLGKARIKEKSTSAEDFVRFAGYIRNRSDVRARLALHDALLVLERGVKATSPSTLPRLLEQYAVTLAEVGRTEDAIAAFERLLVLDPSNATAAEWLGRLRSASKP